MTFYGAIYWPSPETCLDDAFDAPDLAADAELCRAIAAGRRGLHPDAWGNYDPLTTLPPPHRRWERRSRYRYEALPVDPAWEAKHRRPPMVVVPPPPEIFAGEIELTCDECHRHFWLELAYKSGERSTKAMHLRAMGAREGWTHIDGRDRCPGCSAPEDVGNGAGERDHDKQHANGG